MKNYGVTTTINALLSDHARNIAEKLAIKFYTRAENSLDTLLATNNLSALLVIGKDEQYIYSAGGKLFFHPSMAQLRIKNLKKGASDNLIAALQLMPNMSVLDCTLGLATDALVVSSVLESTGTIVGLEANPLIHFVISQGLKTYPQKDLPALANKISCYNINAQDYLATAREKSFDIVYFDPMFTIPVTKSCNMEPLRLLACYDQIDKEVLRLAKNVARQKVVIKEHAHGILCATLGIEKFVGGKYSKVKYGIIDL